MCKDDCGNSNGCNCVKSFVSKVSNDTLKFKNKFSEREIEVMVNELHDLRIQNSTLMDLCMVDKLRDSFISGWYFGGLAKDEGNFNVDKMEECYLIQVEDVIEEQLGNLRKHDE